MDKAIEFIQSLPAKKAKILSLIVVQGYSQEEAAAFLEEDVLEVKMLCYKLKKFSG